MNSHASPRRERPDRLIVVSNRLPFTFTRDGSGTWQAAAGGGGLVTALLPVLRHRGGMWIGWPGAAGDAPDLAKALASVGADAGYALEAVPLTEKEMHDFYLGFSNEIIWPLFHDLQSLCNFDPAYWRTYCDVNGKYAQVVSARCTPRDFIWIHDYHLMNVASDLRRLGVRSRLGFFLHIPFPSPDLFLKLPWWQSLIQALLDFDLVGFQTAHDRRNFVHCARMLLKDVEIEGRGPVLVANVQGRKVRVGNFPIRIDYSAFLRRAAQPEVAQKVQELRRMLPNRKLILGIDRLDYTKGIPLRLRAFHELLARHPELQERVSFIQVVVPSREDIPEYHRLRAEIEQLVGKINGGFVRPAAGCRCGTFTGTFRAASCSPITGRPTSR